MIFVTGDCHANWSKFSTYNFPEQKEMTRDDFVIVCGDFGVWHDDNEERYWLDWLAEKTFTLCFVDGNHENFDRLYSDEFPIVDFYGGKAHQIRENVFHLMRGHIFELSGNKIFAFGGASSHDIFDGILDRDNFESDKEFYSTIKEWDRDNKWFRVNHLSWWKEEMPSEEEMQYGLESLDKYDYDVDFVITHCCPQEIVSLLSGGQYKPDSLTSYFNKISNSLEFEKWFFGHYHIDKQITSEFIALYHKIERIA